MKTNNGSMKISLLALAVQSALFAMPAYADDQEVAALIKPTNFVELGIENTSASSAKFGEYNGLNKAGGKAVGNFSVVGGDGYADGNGTKRWSITGSDLGTTSRTLGATMSNQGQWNLGITYDELRHNLWDTYQTPYQGAMGGNAFTLPVGFGLISTAARNPATLPTGTDNLSPTQQAALNTVDIYSARQNASVSAGVNLAAGWDVKFDFNRLTQSGAKLMGFGSMGKGGVSAETVAILPTPTNYQTDSVNLALNWVGEKGHLSSSYYGSFFKDNYNGVTFDTFAGANIAQTMSTAPSNTFHQLNVSGGYTLQPKTKLTGGVSYAMNTQNENFAYDSVSMVTGTTLPASSLNGDVRNIHADLKLIDQNVQNLALSAAVKYDERNNKTASNFYSLNALDGAANHVGIFPNTPYSNRKTQLELAGDYRLTADQHLKLAYNREDVKRWCDQYAVSTGVVVGAAGYYPAGTNCVVATASKDDKLSAAYKLNANENLNLNVAYSYSNRITDSDPNAITARIGANGNINPAAAANTLVLGQNAGDFRGFYPFFNASRKEQMIKSGVNWQALEQLALGLSGKFTDDKYDSLYGVQNGNSWSMNVDATYSYSDNGSISTYATKQHRQRELLDLQRAASQGISAANTSSATSAAGIAIAAGATWTDNLKDDDVTIGLGAKQGGLMGNKLDLAADLTYSLGQTGYGTQLNYATTSSVASGSLTCSSPQILSCGDLPMISNKLIQLKFTGKYQLDKSSIVALGYIFQQLDSADYYFNGLQSGSTSNTMMPTNQQSGSYSVNVVSATYSYLF
jgi:MtrB/PioB family decaheme-associated outer membrane protein